MLEVGESFEAQIERTLKVWSARVAVLAHDVQGLREIGGQQEGVLTLSILDEATGGIDGIRFVGMPCARSPMRVAQTLIGHDLLEAVDNLPVVGVGEHLIIREMER